MRHGNSQHVGAFVVTASPIFFYITTDYRCTWKYKMCPSTFSPCSATWRKVGTWEPSSPATMYITLLFAELSATLHELFDFATFPVITTWNSLRKLKRSSRSPQPQQKISSKSYSSGTGWSSSSWHPLDVTIRC